VVSAVYKSWRAWVLGFAAVAIVLAALWYLLENPTNQLFGHTVTQVPIHQKVVALTFDDGPNPPYTNQIVNYLHSQHVVATFFVVGKAVARHPDVVRLEAQDGDALGNHTWDHAHLMLESKAHIRQEISRTDQAIQDAAGIRTRLFRPPFGARDYTVINVARNMGYQVIMWSVPLPRDWQSPPPAVIRDRVMHYVKDGSIIVLHDGNRGNAGNRASTVTATKLIVQALQRDGYQLVTVPELLHMGQANVTPVNPVPTE
jgi:peptidoglycan-N-acetylglucosamine deacetylase